MTVENLASVFAPNILRQAEEDPDIEMAASPILSVTIAGFIRAHRQLFLRDLISLAQFESAVLRTDKPSAAADKDTTAPISSRGFVGSLKAKRKPRNRSKTMTLSRAQYGIVDGDSTHSTPEPSGDPSTLRNSVRHVNRGFIADKLAKVDRWREHFELLNFNEELITPSLSSKAEFSTM
ncbi:unnamed protein product [Schistocephalus solidus]|uniref:Rho-GAP domain-containing protein n=1 Tax=Schistocephalus solidus TaxID=70667 RepID=A0A183SD03_SCHSO|nr:unnamed protein product [Schistocephalus solidus]